MTAIALILIVATTAGFAFAKLRYRGSGTVFLAVVAALMVPLQSIIIPEYVNLGKFGLINPTSAPSWSTWRSGYRSRRS